MKPIFGLVCPGLLIDAVLDPKCPDQLALAVYDQGSLKIVKSFSHEGARYVPASVGAGLGRAARFSAGIAPQECHGPDLSSSLEEIFETFLDEDGRATHLLIAFVLSSWFSDCFEIAPVINILGDSHEVSVAMRLLSALCYRPILLGDLGFGGLMTLPDGLRATLLVNNRDLTPRLSNALVNTGRAHFQAGFGKRLIDLFGARALYCEAPACDFGQTVFLQPTRNSRKILTDVEVQGIAERLQPKLLAYRMRRHEEIRKFEMLDQQIQPGSEERWKTWASAIMKCKETVAVVEGAFADSWKECRSARYEDPRCVVAEAMLFFCHQDGEDGFYIRELGERVNDLLIGRHSEMKVEDRKVGAIVTAFGIPKRRMTKGYRVDLNEGTRKQIHHIATAHQVASIQDSVKRCPDCV